MPSATVTCSDEIGVRAEQLHTGPSHCRGAPSQRRQGHVKGPRRGGRGKPQHGRPAPPTEHLDKLSLSSDSTCGHSPEGKIKAKLKINHGQQKLGDAELNQSKTDSESPTDLTQEPPVSTHQQPVCQSSSNTPNTECPKDAGVFASGRGHRGRRRGPHGSVQQPKHLRGTEHWDAPGTVRHHWEGRGLRNRGGAGHNPCGRGGGPRRGHGRGFHQKAEDREVGREGVL